jgi:GntR family transcriptional regulator, carbon starvation induced regulator
MLHAATGTEIPRSRTSDIYDRIRDDIIRGRLGPGLKLKIELLRDHYGVGATPIREALSLLTADGLVERLEQRGFRVAEMNDAEFDELLALRCWVEERAVRQAIARGGKEWEEGIVLGRFHLSRTPRIPPDVNSAANADYEHYHRAFHHSLVAACGSNTLLRLWNQLYNEANRYRYMARLSSYDRPNIGGEHDAIAAAVLARDADLAVRHLVAHYRRTGELLRRTKSSASKTS